MKKSITIVIPALNEEETLGEVVEKCLSIENETLSRPTVLVVDDGSTDRTREVAEAAGATAISHAVNMGVGKAFQTGLTSALKSGADILVNIDADGQFDPLRIPDLIEPILAERADFATASRFKDPKLIPDMPRVKLVGNWLMSRLISQIAGQRFYDVSCGFRAYNRETALRLNLWGEFTYTQESILDLAIKGMRIEEVPMLIQGVRAKGESRVAHNLWRYGWRTLTIILHAYRDFWPLHFFGWLSLISLAPGIALGIFLLIHRFRTGHFTPHIWAGFTGAALLAFGCLILTIGLVGQTLKRIRLNQETLLFYERRRSFEPDDKGDG